MASDLQQQLDRVRAKTTVVGEKYQRLHSAYLAAKDEISELKAALLARDTEIEQLKMQVEYLTVASTVRITGDDLKSTRAMVADLVREIDRCISDLKE